MDCGSFATGKPFQLVPLPEQVTFPWGTPRQPPSNLSCSLHSSTSHMDVKSSGAQLMTKEHLTFSSASLSLLGLMAHSYSPLESQMADVGFGWQSSKTWSRQKLVLSSVCNPQGSHWEWGRDMRRSHNLHYVEQTHDSSHQEQEHSWSSTKSLSWP